MSRLTYSGGEVMGRWRNLLCSIGFHVWYKPQIHVMETFVHGDDRFRTTYAVRINECSVCTAIRTERI